MVEWRSWCTVGGCTVGGDIAPRLAIVRTSFEPVSVEEWRPRIGGVAGRDWKRLQC